MSVLLLGLMFKKVIVDPMIRQGVLPLVISTIALALFLKEGVKDFYSAEAQPFPGAVARKRHRRSFGVVISLAQSRRAGDRLRHDRGACNGSSPARAPGGRCRRRRRIRRWRSILGVPVERMVLYTFLINAVLAAIASLLISPIYLAKFSNGEMLGLAAFVAAIIGGFNQVRGAMLGGLMLGVARQSRGGLRLPRISQARFRWLLLVARHPVPAARSARPRRGAHGMTYRWACCCSSLAGAFIARAVDLTSYGIPYLPQALRHLRPDAVAGDRDRRDRAST